jgi:protein TonB
MKKINFIFLVNFNCFTPRKVYFTEDFKELPSAEKAVYYSTYQEVEKEHKEQLLLDGAKRNSDLFRITVRE